eukprot:TRINITY_DN4445_c0_g1_i1.p1 TRINITY_DN4445_c0_g1~~TRINITY_DN4445_c0_g1_i1.p1  ORF type:complete len:371 (+),score=43.95 TRINITY_DN4445_c0_g1_i1:99-1211(+)
MSHWGSAFRVTTFGESHGGGVGCIVDGVPPRMPLTEADIQPMLDRRRPGQSALTTQRKEEDLVKIQSGTERGFTLGSPISLFVANRDQRPGDYGSMSQIPRPSHADYTYLRKYGIKSASGGGRSSARETIGRVAAGAIAEKWLSLAYGIEIVAWVSSIGHTTMDDIDAAAITRQEVDKSLVRCPDASATEKMKQEIESAQADQDSLGGVVSCVCRNVPPGWGEPSFDKLEAKLAHAMLSIPATKGFEIGSGFAGTSMRGSKHNDPFSSTEASQDGMLSTSTNHSGGIQGGISNGQPIVFRVAFKPPATIGLAQETVDYKGKSQVLKAEGRHDPCVVPRAVPIVEAMAALVLIDAGLVQLGRSGATQKASL